MKIMKALVASLVGLACAASPAVAAEQPGVRVINGQQTTVSEYPFIIAQMRTGGVRPAEQSCTGSVVGKRAVIIAAHCKFGQGEPKYLVYGRDDLVDTSKGTRIEIQEFRVHPKFTHADAWREGYDVAIIFTKTDIPTPAGMSYPKIANSSDKLSIGTAGTAVGYGKTDKDDARKNSKLWKTTLPVVDDSNCRNIAGQFNATYMFCDGYGDGRTGLCQGDSGGPYLVDGKIYGVFSWLRTDCASYNAHAKLWGVLGDWANEQLGDTGPPPSGPGSSFTASCQSSLTCAFDGSGSTGTISSYSWDFGDGTTGNGARVNHTYPSRSATYQAKLTVTDGSGRSATSQRDIRCWGFGGSQGFCFS
ncbi:hypothetical protein ALI144C_22295 [Actinosynnema sp. ALI-1.44]|uniref:trypsin-like serine protease n=1 Tax=Actinosynnema sp. ALI-1.44 TaxID=1933779 RepID=UPI00097C329D|nr:trypsin-like serine protease [Actinosynnema sp. ALI-1.44]ONI81259.1 hypothetical protein ALI144C_22295 [Actinosynnema sp. ALI-1.44]